MKVIKTVYQNSIEFLASKPWLFGLLIPFFYMVLPAPHSKPFVFRELNKIVSAEVRSEFIQQETALTKILCSFSSTILLYGIVDALRESSKHFIQD